VHAALGQAIAQVSALFDVPDSVVRGYAAGRLVDVDSTSNVGGDEEATWDIDVDSYVTQTKVAHYVDLFLGSSRARFVQRLQRGKQYEPLIRQTFRTAGIPEDMYFLALVESGNDPHAYSRAAAVGMWQFMSSTARSVGLRVDWWVDERRDVVKSTWAAARFIRDLQGQFGSLYLAAAAYNGGPGRVSRGLKMYDDKLEDVTGEDCFFALAEESYLRTETKNYVPQLIAAALLGKAPGKYGITLDSVAPFAYDSVTVPPGTPIAAVAKAIGSSVRDVQALNGQILRGVTPPDASVLLRLPVGSAATFDSAFAALDSTERQAFRRVKPKSNETLAALAKRHDVQVRHVQWYNRKLSVRRGKLTAGQTVLIPNPGVVEGALDVPDPGIERYGTSSGGGSTGRVTHVVRRGETLGGIARKYRTSVATLVRLNRLKRNVIYAGQTIIVRGSSSARTTSSTRAVAKKKVVPKKTTARKPVAKSTTNKAVARKPVAKKPAAKKPVAKKPVARKIVEKPS
jgi:membrane-bound lytic murein transglycosylase D